MHTRRTIYVSFSSSRESEVNKFRFAYLGTLFKAASSKFWKWCPLWWSCTLTQDKGPRREIGEFSSKFTSNQYQEHFILYGYKSVVQLMIHPVWFKTLNEKLSLSVFLSLVQMSASIWDLILNSSMDTQTKPSFLLPIFPAWTITRQC